MCSRQIRGGRRCGANVHRQCAQQREEVAPSVDSDGNQLGKQRVARRAAHRQVYEACRDKLGAEHEQCLHQQAEQIDCTQAHIPEQCAQRKTAYALCNGKTGAQFRNCVLQKTLPADCSRASDATVCQQQDKARKLCATKSGSEHRECVLEILSAGQ